MFAPHKTILVQILSCDKWLTKFKSSPLY